MGSELSEFVPQGVIPLGLLAGGTFHWEDNFWNFIFQILDLVLAQNNYLVPKFEVCTLKGPRDMATWISSVPYRNQNFQIFIIQKLPRVLSL